MTKTVLLKLFVAIVITFILILPEYFKTPKASVECIVHYHCLQSSCSMCNRAQELLSWPGIRGPYGRLLELSCLEGCLESNITYSLSSLNYSFVTFLQPVRNAQSIMGIFLHHSNFQNFTRICQEIISEFKTCSLCLVCKSKGNVNFTSQEQTSKVLIVRRSMEVKPKELFSPCQHFNFTVTPAADQLEEYNTTCNLRAPTRKPAMVEEDPTRDNSLNHTCRTTESPNNCTQISLHLDVDAKNITCSTKITWYILVLLVFIFFIILIVYKILEGHRRVQKCQSHKYTTTSVLLRGIDSGNGKGRALNIGVMPEPLTWVEDVLPPIPEFGALSSLWP